MKPKIPKKDKFETNTFSLFASKNPEPLSPKNSVADSVKERIKRLKQKRG